MIDRMVIGWPVLQTHVEIFGGSQPIAKPAKIQGIKKQLVELNALCRHPFKKPELLDSA